MASSLTFIFLYFLVLSCFSVFSVTGGYIGVNYGRVANNLPPPSQVVNLLQSHNITRVKIYDTDPTVLTALSNTNISVIVALPNDLLSSTASDQTFSDNWVESNISQFYPSTKIEAIAVGNEVFVDPGNTTAFLVPAMKNIHNSLTKFNISTIKLSSPIALSALQTSYPSSAGSFNSNLTEPVIKPMLEFLRQTGSYLMVNAYPFFAYIDNSNEISIDYALSNSNSGVTDSGNGLKYYSLLDAQLDAVFAAMKSLQYDDVPIVVSETGWPSLGDENEIGASVTNAASYNGNLVKKVLTNNGTPLKPKSPLDVYLFALFNENQKSGPTSERNYGLFYPSENKVYDVSFTSELTPLNTSKNQVPVSPVSSPTATQTWCVANANAGDEKLQAALDYACGEGGADCRPIQSGSTCFDPDTLVAHASYAFNSYYQKNVRATGTCSFGGAAYVVSQPPQFGKCEFPTGY